MSSQQTVLVVDDNETIIASVADILTEQGYRLLMAMDGSKGLELLAEHGADLIVSDVQMPGMDGYQFYEAVRRNPAWTRIPFIFLTAKNEKQDIRDGYRVGADQYLTKPFEIEDLIVAVESKLRRAQEVRAVSDAEVARTRESITAVFTSEILEPLNSMYSYIGMLEEGQKFMTDEVIQRMLQTARQGTERLIKVVADLMLLAQIDAGLLNMEVESYRRPVILGQVADSVIRDLRPKAEAKKISVDYSQSDVSIMGIASYIQDVLTRLVDNAIKFGTYEGHVKLRIVQQDNTVVITVQDDGIGIEPEELADLYDPRARVSREALHEGHVGLGLAISRGLVQAHRGDIQVASHVTEGTTFTVTLPTK